MEYGGGNALMIHTHVGQDLRHLDRMEDVRFAGFAMLAVVGSGAHFEGPQYDCYAGGLEISVEEVPEGDDLGRITDWRSAGILNGLGPFGVFGQVQDFRV